MPIPALCAEHRRARSPAARLAVRRAPGLAVRCGPGLAGRCAPAWQRARPRPRADSWQAPIASVDGLLSQGIYAAEIRSREVSADAAHITHSQALLSALASNDTAAVHEAVHSIVYTPHWHIVRLRVVRAGRVVADVGGPDVIAPISGSLRSRGRTLGTYVMSVQDNLGYVKLVTRFIGVPVNLYRNGSFLMGTLQPAPQPPAPARRFASTALPIWCSC